MTGPLMTVADLGAVIHKGPRWIKRAAYRREIPSTRVGQTYLFSDEQVAEIVALFAVPAKVSAPATRPGLTQRARVTS